MNIIQAAAILQFLLVVRGSDVAGERKRVGCYYLGATTERYGTLYPEDIDASICTHVLYIHGAINNETQEIYLKPPSQNNKTGGEGFIPRLVKLKAVNPDLKLILHVLYRQVDWLSAEPSGRSKIIQNGIKWLNGSGFDGLDIAAAPLSPEDTEKMADLLCEMKNEFDKYGYSLATSLVGADEIAEETLGKIARCSDYIALLTYFPRGETHRIAPMNMIKSNVDWYVERGIPASKILAVVPAFGAIFTLEDPDDTGLGARVHGPGNDDLEMLGGLGIRNKELLRKLNDSSLGWTIRRDNETKEPYAFSNTRLWTSYEDTTSIEYKARYVLENGLGGIDIVAMEFEDDEGIGGEGRFPLTRTVYNTFRGGN
ncbi:hypothetical protein J437_LFUL014768 [Ladona fulva]|uniref:GH18 domain-containing protein n=1 Tax=Ladona fulva TaxID=123851 RepID=A0A8K0KHP1_LADFU|nr:hypothetical protein J437_LFUL014768 [Ladona fulva]